MPDQIVCATCREQHCDGRTHPCEMIPESEFLRRRIASDLARLAETGADPTDAERFTRLPDPERRWSVGWQLNCGDKDNAYYIALVYPPHEVRTPMERGGELLGVVDTRLDAAELIAAHRKANSDA
jgi:hypothetical protein